MIARKLRLGLIACAVSALITGCALQPSAPHAPSFMVERVGLSAFELAGRMSATDSERAASGRVEWIHSPASDEWTVFNPLGQIVGRLVSTADGAVLHTADGQGRDAPDARRLLPELLGVDVPLDGLAHWVQAVPRPGARVLGVDRIGRPARVSDAGWLIDYVEYSDSAPSAPPRRIDANWGDTRIRLIIDEWSPGR